MGNLNTGFGAARAARADGELDYYPTPPWATRALCEALRARAWALERLTAWEPACGAGHMVRPLMGYFQRVIASDVADRGWGMQCDFLADPVPEAVDGRVDWVITNPPFIHADDFARRALQIANRGVALLVRTAFVEGEERYVNLFTPHRPALILQFVERVVIVKNRVVDPEAINPETGRRHSTAASYAWLIWNTQTRAEATAFDWIPPSRLFLERADDYKEASQ